MACTDNPVSGKSPEKTWSLTMLYNNIAGEAKLKPAWGLSLWIELEKSAVLFDTGGDKNILLDNISSIGLDISKLKSIIISHEHWDHVNGIPAVLESHGSKIPVYVPERSAATIKSVNPEDSITGVDGNQELHTDIWTTGQMQATAGLYEQSILFSKNDNVYVFTGCSHPGIVKIVEKAKNIFPDHTIELVAGGFHLLDKDEAQIRTISDQLKALGVRNLAPSHCTGEQAMSIFREEWGGQYMPYYLGDTYHI